MAKKIPISVIVVTKNEGARIERCLRALQDFDDVVVVDSYSRDHTVHLARQWGARVILFSWDGHYPKKRQWCLDRLSLRHDWVFFVDADEVVPLGLLAELATLDLPAAGPAGYFVKGRYVIGGKALRYGLQNNKLCLFDRRKIAFPVVDDLDLPGMGEIEGHYQPVLKSGYEGEQLGQLQGALLHYAYEDNVSWMGRHERYAAWESAMIARNAYPVDPVPAREALKRFFRRMPPMVRAAAAFGHSYVLKRGFWDGAAGFALAKSRWDYYRLLS